MTPIEGAVPPPPAADAADDKKVTAAAAEAGATTPASSGADGNPKGGADDPDDDPDGNENNDPPMSKSFMFDANGEQVEVLDATLRDTAAHDRPDVWQGRRADEHRDRWREIEHRIRSPWWGVTTRLDEAAARFEQRATQLEAALVPPFVAE